MSKTIPFWTEDEIRNIIRKLDEKTGLCGAELPIYFNGLGYYLGKYRFVEPKAFRFNLTFFAKPHVPDAAVIDVIRHEYAHYYVDAVGLDKYIRHSPRERSHGADWKWACRMVGAVPKGCYDESEFSDLNADALQALRNAEDIPTFDIRTYLDRWGMLPESADETEKIAARIQSRSPERFCELGGEVLHPEYGFGTVQDTIFCDYSCQMVYVAFPDGTTRVLNAKQVYKVVNGTVVGYGKVS